jgi:hypothetical protein
LTFPNLRNALILAGVVSAYICYFRGTNLETIITSFKDLFKLNNSLSEKFITTGLDTNRALYDLIEVVTKMAHNNHAHIMALIEKYNELVILQNNGKISALSEINVLYELILSYGITI